jgi:hypothetical protein
MKFHDLVGLSVETRMTNPVMQQSLIPLTLSY